MKLLITGCKGQLGTEIQKQLKLGYSEIGTIPEALQNAELEAIDADVDAQIADMLKFSLESPLPELSCATTHVYEDFAVENLEVAK